MNNNINKEQLIIGLAGDSGDGIQLIGLQLTHAVADEGKNVNAIPDYPAEIRAPAGTIAGVSSFQLKISAAKGYTPGDTLDILFAMNPAALKANLFKLKPAALIIINKDAFTTDTLKKVELNEDFENSADFSSFTVHQVPVATLVKQASKSSQLSNSELMKCKNMFVLGIIAWLINIKIEILLNQIRHQFISSSVFAVANELILKAGYNYAETVEMFYHRYKIINSITVNSKKNNLGSGNKALADACLAIYLKTKGKFFISGYPITPASTVLQHVAKFQSNYGLRIFQAEDEISSICAAVGAAYGGALSLTVTSGPGFDLKTEGLGLAIITELPLVILNVQRAGPSTGMPTKTEQSDLYAAVFGRHGDSPIPVLAPCSPNDCFKTLIEAFVIAVKYMTPVIVLSDAYLANAVEDISIPDISELPNFFTGQSSEAANFQPYLRDDKTLARSWAVPGMASFEHCIGGLEKQDITGNVCYEAENHQKMVSIRQQKIENIAKQVEDEFFIGGSQRDLLLIGWGSSFGAIKEVQEHLAKNYIAVSMLHLKQIFPLPRGLVKLLKQFKKIVVIEQNTGQLAMMIRAKTLINVEQYNVFDGLPISAEKLFAHLTNNIATKEIKNVNCS